LRYSSSDPEPELEEEGVEGEDMVKRTDVD
jgi:hypothetical protein